MVAGDLRKQIMPKSEYRTPAVLSPFSQHSILYELADWDSGWATIAWTANLAVYAPIYVAESVVLTRGGWDNGATVNGNTDIGVYSLDGATKWGSSGPIANAGATAIQEVNFADFTVPAGYHWLALTSDSGTQMFNRANPDAVILDAIGVKQQTSAYSSGLPATATLNTPTVAICPVFWFTGWTV